MSKSCASFLVAVVLTTAVTAQANIRVNWGAVAGFYFSDSPAEGILGDGTRNSTIAQLVWSADAIADPAHAYLPDYMMGDDVLLDQVTITENGLDETWDIEDSWAQFSAPTFDDGGANIGGYIYGRIFQDNVVQNLDWYYVGPIVAAPNIAPGGTPYDYEMNYNTTTLKDEIDGVHGRQAVPEPATFALFAVGAMLTGLMRRKV